MRPRPSRSMLRRMKRIVIATDGGGRRARRSRRGRVAGRESGAVATLVRTCDDQIRCAILARSRDRDEPRRPASRSRRRGGRVERRRRRSPTQAGRSSSSTDDSSARAAAAERVRRRSRAGLRDADLIVGSARDGRARARSAGALAQRSVSIGSSVHRVDRPVLAGQTRAASGADAERGVSIPQRGTAHARGGRHVRHESRLRALRRGKHRDQLRALARRAPADAGRDGRRADRRAVRGARRDRPRAARSSSASSPPASTPAPHAAIGDLPRGRGILGALIREAHAAAPARPDGGPAVGRDSRRTIRRCTRSSASRSCSAGCAYGNFYLTEKKGGEDFTDEDEEVVTHLASQAAVAIENARLYEAATSWSKQLESLNEVGNALATETDLDRLLDLVARRLRELLDARVVIVALPSRRGRAASRGSRRRERRPARRPDDDARGVQERPGAGARPERAQRLRARRPGGRSRDHPPARRAHRPLGAARRRAAGRSA